MGDVTNSNVVCVNFISRATKTNLMTKLSTKRIKLRTDVIFGTTDKTSIFINETLSIDNRRIFNAARITKKRLKYDFLWINNGNIMIRKEKGSDGVIIRSVEDLDKL